MLFWCFFFFFLVSRAKCWLPASHLQVSILFSLQLAHTVQATGRLSRCVSRKGRLWVPARTSASIPLSPTPPSNNESTLLSVAWRRESPSDSLQISRILTFHVMLLRDSLLAKFVPLTESCLPPPLVYAVEVGAEVANQDVIATLSRMLPHASQRLGS